MPMVRAMRMLNAVEAGTLNGSGLESLLTADTSRQGELNVLLGLRGQARRLAASATAMNAVAASATAMSAVIASPTALSAVVASATAMSAVIASPTALSAVVASATAMNAVAASATAKMAAFNSDAALTAIAASSTAIAACRAAAGYGVVTTSSNTGSTSRAIPVSNTSGFYIALGVSTSDVSLYETITLSTRRSGSTMPNTHITNTGSITSTAALGAICCPLVASFAAVSTDFTTQTFSVGLLRCDV